MELLTGNNYFKETVVNRNQLGEFLSVWQGEHAKSLKMLAALPEDKYDFRPDEAGRSLGELAWHLAETEGFLSHIVAKGAYPTQKLPELERPRTIAAILPAFERVHELAVERVSGLSDQQLASQIPFRGSGPTSVKDLLWTFMLLGSNHHRGQLSLMCRMAGGRTPGLFGPNREEMAEMTAARPQ